MISAGIPAGVRWSLTILSLVFVVVAAYHRVRAAQSNDRLDRTREGWPILIGLRLVGLATIGMTGAWLWNPALLPWTAMEVTDPVRWSGVGGFGLSVAWLIWMFVSLGRNLTDTVVTRADACFVESGPYRYVRNPMYAGILMLGLSLGLALGNWVPSVGTVIVFAIHVRRTRIEEAYLIARFGDEYRGYMKRVGRFFPRFGD
jgi:protein-S-isoprenylcysteine O-methyltransferase Ste14